MNEDKPLISIITATFNAGEFIEKSINSVLNQSYDYIEYIIMDGSSTDNTLEILEKYKDKISTIVSEKDLGIYDAWNKGLKIAKGDWIGFLGADDTYLPDAIYNYVNKINQLNQDNLEYISSKVQLIDKKIRLKVVGKPWTWEKFRLYMTVAHVGSLHSCKFFKKYGFYNLDYKIVGDYEMLLRAKENLKASFLNKITVNMQIGGISNNNILTIFETQKALNELSNLSVLEKYYWTIKRFLHWTLSNKLKLFK